MSDDETLIFKAAGIDDTVRLARALAVALEPGSVLALEGTLGAGKTALVRAMAEALGVDPRDVVSPTFVLLQHYAGRKTIDHLDAYRLRDEDEFEQLGVDELFQSGSIVCIEWADRVVGCLPEERLEIRIEVTGPEERTFEIVARGRRHAAEMERLRAEIERVR